MLKKMFFAFVFLFPFILHAQSYTDDIMEWQRTYKEGLLQGAHPLKPADTGYVRFYPPDERYCVKAFFVPDPSRIFVLRTMHGGPWPAVSRYGYVYFNLIGGSFKLHVYQYHSTDTNLDGKLFIPFGDRTNYKETFPGGRYLDFDADSIHTTTVTLDFNKSYNPHTAYEMGFPYPFVPRVNELRIEIKAGEKIFGKNPGY